MQHGARVGTLSAMWPALPHAVSAGASVQQTCQPHHAVGGFHYLTVYCWAWLVQELRVRGSYLHHKEIKAAQGVKIAAQNLESAVAGTQMLVAGPNDDIEVLKAEVMEDMKDIFGSVDRSGQPCLPGTTSLALLSALVSPSCLEPQACSADIENSTY